MSEKRQKNVKPAVIFGAQNVTRAGYINEYIFACEIKGEGHITYSRPRKPKYHLVIIVLDGSIDLIANGASHHFGKGSYINLPTWTEIYEIRYDKKFHAMATATDKGVVEDIFRNRNPFPPDFRFRVIHSIGGNILEQKDLDTLRRDISNMIDALSDKSHHFAEEVNYAYFYIMLTDMADMMLKQFGHEVHSHNMDMMRSESILKGFSDLVTEHITKETRVEFYAEKLCISKQYLSLIIKEKTGITVGTILASMRAEAAARMLRDPEMTISEIAEELCFSDQSSFGKFFKKHMGTSPLKYRQNLKKTLLTLR